MLRKAALNLFLAAMFGIAGLMLVPAALGLHRYVILTGSMTGTYDPGSIVFDKQVPTSSLKVGDAITYAPPPGMSPNHELVTHRIVRIRPGRGKQRVYQTKGDANKTADRWRFMLPASEQDKVVFHLPYAGFIFAVLGVAQFRMALIGAPALLVALWIVIGMWRDAGEIVRRRERGVAWSPVSASRTPNLGPASTRVTTGSGAVALPITWTRPAAHTDRPVHALGRDRGAPIVLPARLRAIRSDASHSRAIS